ncbi:hypothetical protein LCGC14_1359420 [marine sediment metagenome]|uniref:Ice-binding protein C-terminal domain-containing protein n=1 Tax=marine sediment metagenome TaxID=412755 RepID=A0A0F9K8J8_9ZZZZ
MRVNRGMKKWVSITTLLAVSYCSLLAAQFEDDFENDAVGAFPSSWTNFHDNADAEIIDDATDPGAVFAGDNSLRVTFNGGYGSGIQTSFDAVTEGVLSFRCRVDSASDDLHLMGLFSYADTEAPGSQLAVVVASPAGGTWHYAVAGYHTTVPLVFGVYRRFDLHFDTDESTATLYIDGALTDVGTVSMEDTDAGVTTLRSNDDTGPGTAEWYLDEVSVVPEPTTLLMLALGGLALIRRRRT